MGFTRTQAQRALMNNNNNLENALELLLGNEGNDEYDGNRNNNQYNRYSLIFFGFLHLIFRNDYNYNEPVKVNNNNNNYGQDRNRSKAEGTLVFFFIHSGFSSYLTETEAAMIREQIGIVERDIRSHNNLTQSLKTRTTPFLQEYKEMQSRISMSNEGNA